MSHSIAPIMRHKPVRWLWSLRDVFHPTATTPFRRGPNDHVDDVVQVYCCGICFMELCGFGMQTRLECRTHLVFVAPLLGVAALFHVFHQRLQLADGYSAFLGVINYTARTISELCENVLWCVSCGDNGSDQTHLRDEFPFPQLAVSVLQIHAKLFRTNLSITELVDDSKTTRGWGPHRTMVTDGPGEGAELSSINDAVLPEIHNLEYHFGDIFNLVHCLAIAKRLHAVQMLA
mmetsp:Transcript_127809/g.367979  ORF Transcript_127809/g.367979 Transcript_127809/m.367979 type:complete len:233 (-) Transcript_127809:592-1290(-)